MSAFLGQVSLGRARLGQAAPACEQTPEGGTRCADGTYLPPGCQPGDPATVQGAPAGTPIWPWIVGAGALAAGAAVALSGHHQLGLETTLENVYPAVAADLRAIAGKITGERAADAWNFSQMQEATKKKQDLLFQQKAAEEKLRNAERLWEQTHRNAESLQAATAEVDRLGNEIAQENQKIQEYRGYVDANAAMILRYRENAEATILSLPREYQDQARVIIDPCYKPSAAMRGSMGHLGQVNLVNRVPGGYGVEFGREGPRKRPEGLLTPRSPRRSLSRAPWAPYMGQAPVATAALPSVEKPPTDLKDAAAAYGVSAGLGALVGVAMNLIIPSTRRTRKEGVQMAAFSSALSVAGYLLNVGFGENPFFSTMVRIGGLFTGSAIADLILPGSDKVCIPAEWRRA